MDAQQVAELCGGAKSSGQGWVCRCPAHDDANASMSITEKDGKLLYYCHAGCDQKTLHEVITNMTGPSSLPVQHTPAPGKKAPVAHIVDTYDYTDEHGELAYQVCRMEPKTFLQRRKARDSDPMETIRSGWVWNLKDTPLYPYNLVELLKLPLQKSIIIVEGEKDVIRLAKIGVVATTNSSGAGKWRPEFAKYFKGRTVIIIPDNDPAGHNHAVDIWESLDNVASRIKIVHLPGLGQKQDMSDWLDNGNTKADLVALVIHALNEEQTKPERVEIAKPAPKPASIANLRPRTPAEPDRSEPYVPPAPALPPPPAMAPAPRVFDNVTPIGNAQRKPEPAEAAYGPEYSDDSVAGQFSFFYADKLRYVAHWDRWFCWDGNRWHEDLTLETNEKIRDHCRATAMMAYLDTNIPSLEKRKAAAVMMAGAKKFNNVRFVASADRRHAATTTQWDNNPWVLCTPNGTVDLKLGILNKPNPNDHCTKMTRATPVGGPCPNWLKFLDSVCCGDQALVDYLQRVVGYSLTGITSEHALFFIFGSGANGKSTFLSTLGHIIGDYTAIASMETFVATAGERHTTELARLRGARFVAAQETEEGRRWAEAKIKELTGGTPISARFMRQDFFEFTPQFKLMIAGNHKPTLRNVDEAMRRRLHLIPFLANIPPSKRDQSLPDKLLAEGDQILAWAIAGCLKWQEQGLNPPDCVLDATREYMQDEDVFGSWIEMATEKVKVGQATARALYTSFGAYAEAEGEFVISQKRFVQLLESRGFPKRRTSSGVVFMGISFKDSGRSPERGLYDDD